VGEPKGRPRDGLAPSVGGSRYATGVRARRPVLLVSVLWSLIGCDVGDFFGGETGRVHFRRALPRDPGTLIVGRPADAIYLDPGRPTDSESVEVLEQLYDKLLHQRAGSNVVEPGLATSWEVADQGRVWTFHLRRGVTFHDGTPFDADAVVFSMERQRDPLHPFHRPDFTYWENLYRYIQKVEKIDQYTVRITIDRRYAPFEANMAMFPVAIVSPDAVREHGDDFSSNPVGTGPFRFVSWEKGSRIVLERNPDYWGGAPSIERLIFQTMPDPRQRLIALEGGAIDIVYSILPEELQFVELHPDIELHKTAANNVAYLAFNTQKPPFDDVRVRQAANYAVNKEPIVKLIFQGMAIPAEGALPPTQWGYYRVRKRYGYDPDRARELLAEAAEDGRFDPKRRHTLYVPTTPRPYLPNPEQVARVLQANLAEVGIQTTLIAQSFRAHVTSVQAGDHDLCVLGWVGDNGDPDNFLYTLFDRDNTVPGIARNVAFFRDPEVHGLLIMAQESESRDERERLYARVQELIAQMAPWVPLAHSQVAVAARNDIGGVVINPSGHVYYKDVRRDAR
jgi:peptide/nickel transport system substrate-binding protein